MKKQASYTLQSFGSFFRVLFWHIIKNARYKILEALSGFSFIFRWHIDYQSLENLSHFYRFQATTIKVLFCEVESHLI